MKEITVLMTGAGAPGAPGIISCYKNNGERQIRVIGVDMRERVPTIKKLDAFATVPAAGNSEFIGTILSIAKKYRVDVIQPLVTKELELFARNEKLFSEAGIKVCVSAIESLMIANDKGCLLNRLKKIGLPVPVFSIIHEANEFYDACIKAGYPSRTICFKPTKANGSRGFRIIDNTKDRGKLLFEEKPNSLYIELEDAQNILSSMSTIPELLVMEYLPGREYSVDMLVDNGQVIYCIPRLRIAMNGGISTRCVVENNHEVIGYCHVVAEHLNLHGNIGIQVRYSHEEEVNILEINPRLQGSVVACAAAGVNLPYFAIKQALGEEVPYVEINWGIEMIRYWSELYYDAAGHAYTF